MFLPYPTTSTPRVSSTLRLSALVRARRHAHTGRAGGGSLRDGVMFGRRGASVHRCPGSQLRLKVPRGGTHGHREPPACDLESGTVLLKHMAWCIFRP